MSLMKKNKFNKDEIVKIAELSNISLKKGEEEYFAAQFNETISAVDRLNELETKNIKETDHVTGLENVYRKDVVEKIRVLSQTQALSNARRKYKGFFVVKGVLDEK